MKIQVSLKSNVNRCLMRVHTNKKTDTIKKDVSSAGQSEHVRACIHNNRTLTFMPVIISFVKRKE